jgi:hypothetical protein
MRYVPALAANADGNHCLGQQLYLHIASLRQRACFKWLAGGFELHLRKHNVNR